MRSSTGINGVRIQAHARVYVTGDIMSQCGRSLEDASLMAKLELHDTLEVRIERSKHRKSIHGSGYMDRLDLWKCGASRFADKYGLDGEVRVSIDQQIPMGWDLGEDSSVAAAVLRALAILHQVPQDHDFYDMSQEVSPALGFFVRDDDVLGSIGPGKEMYPIRDVPPIGIVLANPRSVNQEHSTNRHEYGSPRLLQSEFFVADMNRVKRIDEDHDAANHAIVPAKSMLMPCYSIQIEDIVAVLRKYDGCPSPARVKSGYGAIGFYADPNSAMEAAKELRRCGYDARLTSIKRPRS